MSFWLGTTKDYAFFFFYIKKGWMKCEGQKNRFFIFLFYSLRKKKKKKLNKFTIFLKKSVFFVLLT
jgi:hypothetical protein